eukprot:m.168330 g.168330  ORF g.168330 m.168330 type:complete len:87 (-) comp9907_c0_seq4:20-280(-)
MLPLITTGFPSPDSGVDAGGAQEDRTDNVDGMVDPDEGRRRTSPSLALDRRIISSPRSRSTDLSLPAVRKLIDAWNDSVRRALTAS